jgi:toxin ParE1/3/4
MSRIRLTDLARLDLYGIWEHNAQDSPTRARYQIDRLNESFDALAAMPGIGRSQAHRRRDLRSWPVGSYLVFYRPFSDGIEAVRVLHGSRDLDSLL